MKKTKQKENNEPRRMVPGAVVVKPVQRLVIVTRSGCKKKKNKKGVFVFHGFGPCCDPVHQKWHMQILT